MSEKRKYKRLSQVVPVRHRKQKEANVKSSQALDISTGGMRIASEAQLEIGSELNIEMHINKSAQPFYAKGEVVWLKEKENKTFDVGIKFVRVVQKTEIEGF
ncbi:MAG: PilZ domain-containing protein [PVC group bacterium]|nr:PilZ domain-containing protein [PVC group bacterium]